MQSLQANTCYTFTLFLVLLKLRAYWLSIFEVFSNILAKMVHPCPLTALFDVVTVGSPLERRHMSLIAFCSLLARRQILRKWKDPCPLTYGHWLREVMAHMHFEKIRCSLKGHSSQFYHQWQPFV